MDSFATSDVSANVPASRELSIASSFVKQYYTLLNKAPYFIHNFYSQDSTFIHGTIQMANEQYTEPVVGRERIKKKVEELKLNDCRAKITQIDCLETLASGLVIQVIGELSNNGKPMRRFLQTFVLAPSPDESASRQDADSQHHHQQQHNPRQAGPHNDRRGMNKSENISGGASATGSANNQKFFVLNSIFRYQDDGPDSEFEDDTVSITANTSIEGTNGGGESRKSADNGGVSKQATAAGNLHIDNGPISEKAQIRGIRPAEIAGSVAVKNVDAVERLASGLEDDVKMNNRSNAESELSVNKREIGGSKIVANGTGNSDKKKNETSDKTTENGRQGVDASVVATPTATAAATVAVASATSSATIASNQAAPPASASRPQPSNEPKTWANMVRNANPPIQAAPIQVNANAGANTNANANSNANANANANVNVNKPTTTTTPTTTEQPRSNPRRRRRRGNHDATFN